MRRNDQPFGAFYSVTETFNDLADFRHGQPILYGAPRLHAIECAPGVYYIRLAKDPEGKLLDIDRKGEFICDFTLMSADSQALALNYMQTGDISGFHPVTQMILSVDELNGLDRETIIETRAGIMSAEFLGFVPTHVFMVRPELAGSDSIEVDGETVEVPRFNPGSWYLGDNPEFLA